jgi:hypothetical protein
MAGMETVPVPVRLTTLALPVGNALQATPTTRLALGSVLMSSTATLTPLMSLAYCRAASAPVATHGPDQPVVRAQTGTMLVRTAVPVPQGSRSTRLTPTATPLAPLLPTAQTMPLRL